eukprot:4456763-Pyramimonas_sp.AAC.2
MDSPAARYFSVSANSYAPASTMPGSDHTRLPRIPPHSDVVKTKRQASYGCGRHGGSLTVV